MKNRILLVFLAVALVVSLVAFGACAKEEEEPPVTEEWQWPEKLLLVAESLVTDPTYPVYIAWTTLLAKDTGMVVRIVIEDQTPLQDIFVNQGRFFCKGGPQFKLTQYASTGVASRDGGPWQSRALYPAGRAFQGPCCAGDLGIKTPYDIKPGMAITASPLLAEPQMLWYGVLAWANIDPEDMKWVPTASITSQIRQLIDGKVDMMCCAPGVPAMYEVEGCPRGLAWIDLNAEADPEGAKRLRKYYPWIMFGQAYGGVPSGEGIWMAGGISPFTVSVNADPELVYRIVKWLDENYDRYKDGHPWCEHITIDNTLEYAKVSAGALHDGTVRYLEELGVWTEELEARRQYNIEILTLWVDAYQAAIAMADDQGIAVDPENDEWQELWENYRRSQNLPLLVTYQGPGIEQPTYAGLYDEWERIKPFK